MGGWDIIRGRERKEGLATKEFEDWRVRRYTKQIFTLLYFTSAVVVVIYVHV
jgi:hypothetical protein